jgi:anion-transporting  ArsA/GET3 family ATPase
VKRGSERAPAPPEPRVIVCAGGGGVGKTTTSAALAVALARDGARVLVVTIDPARRLAGAMGVAISDVATPVPLVGAKGSLHALMPDPRRSMRTFLEHLFAGHPAGRERLLSNRLYQGLADAAAGVHELVAMNLVAHASVGGAFEVIVIDTAPSRHAIDFVTYPGRLAALLSGRPVGWLAGLAQRAATPPGEARSGGLLSWGGGRVEGILARVTGPHLVRDTASLFAELATVRERFVDLTDRASTLLLGVGASYVLVAAPTAAARDDVLYLAKRLTKLGRTPSCLVLNRADTVDAPFLQRLRGAAGVSPPIARAIGVLEAERASRSEAAQALERALSSALPRVPIVRLPHVEAVAPEAIVGALSESLALHLGVLLSTAR